MKQDVLNNKGKVVSSVELDGSVFKTEVSEHVLHLAVKATQANRRQGTHATKTKSTVSGTGKKPFKQKGTGGARQGSLTNPHQPGGAVAHGPQPRDYTQGVNKKMKVVATRMALSNRASCGAITVVDDFGLDKYSTKVVVRTLKSLNITDALILDERKDDLLYKSGRNIHGVEVTSPSQVNAEAILRRKHLLVTSNGLEALTSRLKVEANS